MDNLFFELIQVSLGGRKALTCVPSADEWMKLHKQSVKQSLIAVCFMGVQRLKTNCPAQVEMLPPSLRMQWLGMAASIQRRNDVMDEYTHKTLRYFREKGFPCMVLKGQGVATLYGELGKMRQSGDIDVWLSGGRKRIDLLSRKELGKITVDNYHHIVYDLFKDIEVEAHIYPAFLSNPFKNRALRRFCEPYQPVEGGDDCPSLAFNRVFILLHCYNHFCGHGVGMRQLMDYYFVLSKGFTEEERMESLTWCERLGMKRFVKATMWVMKEVFALPDRFLLCEPDEKEGRFFLNEIMYTGNMGYEDTRFRWGQRSAFGRFVESQKRNLHLVTHYPHEICWSPLYNLSRFVWIKYKGMR